jgi:CDP-diacylglycerol--glycerol-3-phosphate 3-phosphatidyltransferase
MPEVTHKESWLNLPNFLTVLRFFLVPLILILLFREGIGWQLLGTALFILAALTDSLDGFLARRRRQITQFGKFADPLADKLLTLSVFTAIALRREFSSVAVYLGIWVAIIAVREIGITLMRIWAINRGTPVVTSFWGKAKTTAQLFTIITTLVLLNFRQAVPHWDAARSYYPGDQIVICAVNALVFFCMVITLISGILYLSGSRLEPHNAGGKA